jgi:hypothetical protein
MTYTPENEKRLQEAMFTNCGRLVTCNYEDLFCALSEITRLTAENAAHKWVSVSERLPKPSSFPKIHPYYLVISRGVILPDYCRYLYLEDPPDYKKYPAWVNKELNQIFGVTHYLPFSYLPTPPAGGENE